MAGVPDFTAFNFNSLSERPYGNSIVLNEIHNLFPAFLYDNAQFQSVDDVFNYVDNQMNDRFNIFNTNRNSYRQRHPRNAYVSRGNGNRRGRGNQRYQTNRFSTPPQQTQQPVQASAYLSSRSPSATPIRINSDLFANILAAAIVDNPVFYEPVLVTPTPEQLASATTNLTAVMNLETPCAVCQDSMNTGQQVRRLNVCGHAFHTPCVDTWFQRNVHCPVCRHDIRE